MDTLLPLWIIGAPLVLGVIDKFMTPKVSRSATGYADSLAARPFAASRLPSAA